MHARTASVRCRIGGDFRKLDREVYAICSSAFLADVVFGAMTATFPVHARSCGLDPIAIGSLSGAAGLLQLGAAIPMGFLSDRIGRQQVILVGHATYIAGMACMAFASQFWSLLGGRLLFAVGTVAVFQIASARLGDVVPSQLRHCAFGLLSAMMALGFGIGPFLGGFLSDTYGHTVTYLMASAVAAIALIIVWIHVEGTTGLQAAAGMCQGLIRGFSEMARSPDLLLASFANMIAGITFAGTLGIFLPLYGHERGISQTAVGTMLAVRSCVSAFGRIPASLLAQRLGGHTFLLLGLLCDALAMFGIWASHGSASILALLALEGLAYGGVVVAGQTYVANHTTDESRGTVGGIYAMASGLAGTFAPFALGVAAERWGIRSVFAVSGIVVAFGVLAFAVGLWLLRSRSSFCSPAGTRRGSAIATPDVTT